MAWAEPVRQQLVVLLASHGDGKVHTSNPDSRVSYILLNREALGEPDVQTCIQSYERQKALPLGSMCEDHGSFGSGNEILGVALIEPFALHNALLPLSREQLIQYKFWQRLLDIDLHEIFFWFHCLMVRSFKTPLPLLTCAARCKSRSFSLVIDEWRDKIFTERVTGIRQADLDFWKGFCQGEAPGIVLKLPKPFTFLVLSGLWKEVGVPDVGYEKTIAIHAGWGSRRSVHAGKFGQALWEIRCSNKFKPVNAEGPENFASFNLHSVEGRAELLNLLQTVSSVLQHGRPCEGEAREKLCQDVLAAARSMQKLDDEEIHFQHASSHKYCKKNSKYKPIKLLEFFWLADLLKQDASLREACDLACKACLPRSQYAEAKLWIQGQESSSAMRIPHPSTISRARGRIDCAWMLLFREMLLDRMRSPGGVRVYIQTDATWQAAQEYQITLMNIVDAGGLCNLYEDWMGEREWGFIV